MMETANINVYGHNGDQWAKEKNLLNFRPQDGIGIKIPRVLDNDKIIIQLSGDARMTYVNLSSGEHLTLMNEMFVSETDMTSYGGAEINSKAKAFETTDAFYIHISENKILVDNGVDTPRLVDLETLLGYTPTAAGIRGYVDDKVLAYAQDTATSSGHFIVMDADGETLIDAGGTFFAKPTSLYKAPSGDLYTVANLPSEMKAKLIKLDVANSSFEVALDFAHVMISVPANIVRADQHTMFTTDIARDYIFLGANDWSSNRWKYLFDASELLQGL